MFMTCYLIILYVSYLPLHSSFTPNIKNQRKTINHDRLSNILTINQYPHYYGRRRRYNSNLILRRETDHGTSILLDKKVNEAISNCTNDSATRSKEQRSSNWLQRLILPPKVVKNAKSWKKMKNDEDHDLTTSTLNETKLLLSIDNSSDLLDRSSQNSIKKADKPTNRTKSSNLKKIAKNKTSPEIILEGLDDDRTKPLTISDLEYILNKNQLNIRRALTDNNPSIPKPKKGVALPQESVLTYRDVQIGSTIITSLLGMILGITVSPNLWLIGCMLGGWYGQTISKPPNQELNNNYPLSSLLIPLGRTLAKYYLKVRDILQTLFFMYKTGQLSYEYYTKYQSLDDKFRITDKIDAWNARFIKGKENFDKWERENEVGRKVLATLRTFVLVEDESFKKMKGSSSWKKFRLVRFLSNVLVWMQKFIKACWNAFSGNNQELYDIFQGIKIQIRESNLEELSQRVGSGITALVAINLLGVLFTSAPSIVSLASIGFGVLYPTWVRDGYFTIKDFIDEAKERGGGNAKPIKSTPSRKNQEYHYFVKRNGSKRWYRTGQSMFYSYDTTDNDNFWNTLWKQDDAKKDSWWRFNF